ncbi:MAG: CDP-alcohol phosphatidyltransferase family protein [Planctomycetota bacterium]|jgi:CDP-diacylglycerol--serine O-phosphatidyltransferase|nr:CDP-alcohol phosphatidyltransferase family protein [Planctomycetota bacterium]
MLKAENNYVRRPFRRVHILPSLLTVGNFACGFLSIIVSLNAVYCAARPELRDADGQAEMAAALTAANFIVLNKRENHPRPGNPFPKLLTWACILIFVGMVFDSLDGMVARRVGAASAFGTELDSLADVVTFGLAPPVMVNAVWISAMPSSSPWLGTIGIFGFIFAISAVLRLARYNIRCGSSDRNTFTGLPSPAAAGCVAAAVLLIAGGYGSVESFAAWVAGLAGNDFTGSQAKAHMLGVFLLLPGILMITTIPFAHLANRYLAGKKSFFTLVAAVLLLALTWLEPRIMLFAGFNGYMLGGLLLAAWRLGRRGQARARA